VTFIGRRVVLFGYPPLKPFTEALEWLTDILAAHNGAEQRRALRYAPRQKFSAGFRVAGVQAVSRLAALAFGWHHRAWGLPLWAEASLHQTDILEGAESVAVATAGADYREGGLAVIWRSPEDYEVFEVLALSADYLETSRPLANAWTGRKFIMPVRLAYFEGHPEWDARRSGLAEMRVQFIISDNVHLAGYEAGQTYGGLPVLTRPNLLSGGREAASLVKEMKFLDSETGPFQADCFDLYQRRRVERRTALRSRAEAWDFRLLLHELAGRQGVVWIPTFRPDLVLLADVGADEVNLIVQETGAALHYGSDNPLRGHLAFIAPDGAIVCRAVTGITAGDPGQEIVTIDSGLPEAFGPGDYTISWLALSRLDADRVEIEWRDVGRAEVRTAWREVAA